MKKVIAIFILLQIVTNNAFGEELIKLPRLFTHYYHHAQEHKDTEDFFEYLHNHYCDTHEKDAHKKEHQEEDNGCNLPFKHCDGCCINTHSPSPGFIAPYLSADYVSVMEKQSLFISENDQIESLDIAPIWQPPKIS